jgi:hypothetical protein
VEVTLTHSAYGQAGSNAVLDTSKHHEAVFQVVPLQSRKSIQMHIVIEGTTGLERGQLLA